MRKVVVIGAGGHAKVVISTLQAAGDEVSAIYDDNTAKWGTTVLGVPVVGGIAELEAMRHAVAVIAIGNNSIRKALAERLTGIKWTTAVHPRAYVDPTAQIGLGTVVFAGAVIQTDAVVGDHGIVNTGATVDHDCVVGDYTHIAPGAHLAGGVHVGEGALMGIGSAAIPNSRVGRWTVVGAGGVVVRDLPERVTAVGVPATPRSIG